MNQVFENFYNILNVMELLQNIWKISGGKVQFIQVGYANPKVVLFLRFDFD